MGITLTGSSGFVGQNLSLFLKNTGVTIDSISRDQLFEIEDFSNSSSIIHLAGKAHDMKYSSNAEEYYRVNFDLTKQLYNAFLNSDAEKFIFISSVKASADKVSEILTEEDLPSPITHYGKSKLLAEKYIQAQPLPKGKSYYILRPCMVHGPGNKGNLNMLYAFVKRGIPYPLAAFDNKRSFLSVENLCFVIQDILEQNILSGVYHVADDESLSTREIVEEIAISLGLRPKLWNIPTALVKAVAKVGDWTKLPINTERLDKLTENYIVSNEKIKKAIGKELPISAREGMRKTIQSFANNPV